MSAESAKAFALAEKDFIFGLCEQLWSRRPSAFSATHVLARFRRKSLTHSSKVFVLEICLSALVKEGKLFKVGRSYTLELPKDPVTLPETLSASDAAVAKAFGAHTGQALLEQLRTPITLAGLLCLPAPSALAHLSAESRRNRTRALLRWLRALGRAQFNDQTYEWVAIKEDSQ